MALIRCNDCGQMISDKAKACPHCGAPVQEQKKSLSPLLIIVSALLGLLGGILLYYAVVKPDSNKNQQHQEEVQISKSQTSDSKSPDSRNIVANKQRDDSRIYMDLWGSIGEVRCNQFIMDGTTGSYLLDGPDNVKRTLELVSFDEVSGQCEINAYLRGEYIGKFVGKYKEYSGEHAADVYKGEFISVRGTTLEFFLYVD